MARNTASFTGTVNWSNGAAFDGFMAVGIALPGGAGQYAAVYLDESRTKQRLPLWYRIPILNGQFDQNARVFYTTSLEPPNCQYSAYFFDASGRLIAPAAGTAPLFTVTTPTVSLVIPTLTAPTAAVTPPTPET